MPEARAAHAWQFFRSGGFDQVRLSDADDLRHLGSLDLKLWAVLACPSAGLEFDPRTLQLLDRAARLLDAKAFAQAEGLVSLYNRLRYGTTGDEGARARRDMADLRTRIRAFEP